jgi:hypothetical protein
VATAGQTAPRLIRQLEVACGFEAGGWAQRGYGNSHGPGPPGAVKRPQRFPM